MTDEGDESVLKLGAVLTGEEAIELTRLLGDLAGVPGLDPGLRDAAAAGWTLLGNRAAVDGGVGHDDPQRDAALLARIARRPVPGDPATN